MTRHLGTCPTCGAKVFCDFDGGFFTLRKHGACRQLEPVDIRSYEPSPAPQDEPEPLEGGPS